MTRIGQHLSSCGLRSTPQRQRVYAVLIENRDHPTAEEVFLRARRKMPGISLATIYNCLEALVRSGLVRQLTLDRGAARFCPNMQEHCHFYCDCCGKVFDMPVPTTSDLGLNDAFKVERIDLTLHGRCPDCHLRPASQCAGQTLTFNQ